MHRLDVPSVSNFSQPVEQLAPHARQNVDGWSRQMVPIEGVKQCAAGLLTVDKAVRGESIQYLENSSMGFPSQETCDLSSREGSVGARKDVQHRAIQSGTYGCVWLRCVHRWLSYQPCGQYFSHVA